MGAIVASGRAPTPSDAGSLGQPLKNKVLAKSGCGCKVFCMEDIKSEAKSKQLQPKGWQSEPQSYQNTSQNPSGPQVCFENTIGTSADIKMSGLGCHLADVGCHVGSHPMLTKPIRCVVLKVFFAFVNSLPLQLESANIRKHIKHRFDPLGVSQCSGGVSPIGDK